MTRTKSEERVSRLVLSKMITRALDQVRFQRAYGLHLYPEGSPVRAALTEARRQLEIALLIVQQEEEQTDDTSMEQTKAVPRDH